MPLVGGEVEELAVFGRNVIRLRILHGSNELFPPVWVGVHSTNIRRDVEFVLDGADGIGLLLVVLPVFTGSLHLIVQFDEQEHHLQHRKEQGEDDESFGKILLNGEVGCGDDDDWVGDEPVANEDFVEYQEQFLV